MAEGLDHASEVTRTRPLLPLLTRVPHALGLDVIPSFQVMNVLYAFTLYLFSVLILDAYGARMRVKALVVANLALCIATSKMFAYYPVQIDLGVLALVTAGILSPEVAGVGLTIVEANHVIHYGRWWNPAKEAQATDRVYRLGQTRDVHVYYPVATDPLGQFETFDEKLDALLRRRRALASEFLSPMPAEDELRKDLVDSLADASGSEHMAVALSPDEIKSLSWAQFEALAAALEQVRGNTVCLTPLTGDDGIDVIASNASGLRLIQCKHTMWGSRVDQEVVFEVVAGFDAYRARYLTSRQRQRPLVPILVTNGEFSKAARQEATVRGITLVSGTDLQISLMGTTLSAQAVGRLAKQRLASMEAVRAWLKNQDSAASYH
ncbi:MAG: restriction endonuclease [Vicinamibacterales bacterium]